AASWRSIGAAKPTARRSFAIRPGQIDCDMRLAGLHDLPGQPVLFPGTTSSWPRRPPAWRRYQLSEGLRTSLREMELSWEEFYKSTDKSGGPPAAHHLLAEQEPQQRGPRSHDDGREQCPGEHLVHLPAGGDAVRVRHPGDDDPLPVRRQVPPAPGVEGGKVLSARIAVCSKLCLRYKNCCVLMFQFSQ
uniref:Chromosome 11 open reading frame 52 n=1 Tax=Macrostomum lignano TaxID=282301 RepID=A0A1I8FP17_9PLAT